MFPSNVAKNNKNLRILTGPSDICHLKITKFQETCKSDPLMCQSDKNLCNLTGPSVIDSVSCQICQNRQDSEKISEKDVHLTCQTWHLSSIFRWFWPSAHPKLLILCRGEKSHSSFPCLPPTLAVCLGYLLKNPLFLCICKRPRSQGEGSVWGWLSLAPAH